MISALLLQAAAPGFSDLKGMIVPMGAIMVVFYLMLIRPQQKKEKQRQTWLDALERGSDVVTSGGIIGRVSLIEGNVVTLEIAEKVRIKVVKSHIAGKVTAAETPTPAGSTAPKAS